MLGKCAFERIPPDYPLGGAKNVRSNELKSVNFPIENAFFTKSAKNLEMIKKMKLIKFGDHFEISIFVLFWKDLNVNGLVHNIKRQQHQPRWTSPIASHSMLKVLVQ